MKVIVMRGVPGSGKSTYAQHKFPNALICSADDYFVDQDGVYRHDPAKLGEAHQACFRKFLTAVTRGEQLVVVDNTSVRAWEISPYVLAAEALGYTVEIITLVVDPIRGHGRNIHGVPYDTVVQMAFDLLREQLPPWWSHLVIEDRTRPTASELARPLDG